MKKILSLILIICFTFYLITVYSSADDAINWYIKKKGHNIPEFPECSDFVNEHGGIILGDSNKKRIYLTFDAGYENGNVEKIVDILNDKGIQGTFFILKRIIEKNPELIRKMENSGHLIANHTANHKDMTTLSDEEMTNNLQRLETLYKECTGKEMSKLFRFPEGRFNKDKILLCERLGYKCVFWSLTYADWDNSRQPSVEYAVKTLLDNTHNGAIILLHPTASTNVEALPILIDEWRKEGYTFGLISEL